MSFHLLLASPSGGSSRSGRCKILARPIEQSSQRVELLITQGPQHRPVELVDRRIESHERAASFPGDAAENAAGILRASSSRDEAFLFKPLHHAGDSWFGLYHSRGNFHRGQRPFIRSLCPAKDPKHIELLERHAMLLTDDLEPASYQSRCAEKADHRLLPGRRKRTGLLDLLLNCTHLLSS